MLTQINEFASDEGTLDLVQTVTDKLFVFLNSLSEEDLEKLDQAALEQLNSSGDRRLQNVRWDSSVDLERLRFATLSLVKIKYSQADQKCVTMALGTEEVKEESYFRMTLNKEPIRTNTNLGGFSQDYMTVTFQPKDQGLTGRLMTMQIPDLELVTQTLIRNPNTSWICFQQTFFSVNPILLVRGAYGEWDKVDNSNTIATITTIDSNKYKLLDMNTLPDGRQQRGIQKLQKPFLLDYPYQFPFGANSNNFDTRDVVCAHFWTDTEYIDDGLWSDEGCDTTFDFVRGYVKCSCQMIAHKYYKLMKKVYIPPTVAKPIFDVNKYSDPV